MLVLGGGFGQVWSSGFSAQPQGMPPEVSAFMRCFALIFVGVLRVLAVMSLQVSRA